EGRQGTLARNSASPCRPPPQTAPLARRGPAPTARHPLLPPLAGRPGGGACAAPTIFVREPAPTPPLAPQAVPPPPRAGEGHMRRAIRSSPRLRGRPGGGTRSTDQLRHGACPHPT